MCVGMCVLCANMRVFNINNKWFSFREISQERK